MVILLIPNLGCDHRCVYCFEEKKPARTIVNVEAMKDALKKLEENPRLKGSYIGLHGGEATLTRREDLEELIEFASQYSKSIGLQTHGATMDNQLLDLLCKYNMHVGVSIDGPEELNILRGPDPKDRIVTEKYTTKVHENIKLLCDTGINVGVISVLHDANVGTDSRLEKFEDWLVKLRDWGVSSFRTNLLFAISEVSKPYELSIEKAIGAWISLYEFRKLYQLEINPFMEMIQNLKGNKVAPCVYGQCDIFATPTISILPDGSVGNCDRTFGPNYYLRSSCRSHPGRYRALQLDQCKDCRYWHVCHGGCPMEGVGGDWRNKTRWCTVIYNLYAWIEKDLTGTFTEVNLGAR